MMQETRNGETPVAESQRARVRGLDDLAARSCAELEALYRGGRCPTTIGEIAGRPRGRMLAVRGLDRGGAFRLLRRLAAATRFPWGGKSFEGRGERGQGINRVHLGGRHSLFPFLLERGTSRIDGAPCVVLDYDLPDNPGLIRRIHDEVREIEPGLLLGPAMWKSGDGGPPSLVLWFALDLREPARPIGHGRETVS
jgi:hypothetical protein